MNHLVQIENDFRSFQRLIDLYENNKNIEFSQIVVSISKWFAANQSAVLGAILDELQKDVNEINFDRIDPNIKVILQKNGFLDFYGYSSVYDNNSTTIPYKKLEPTDNLYFTKFLEENLLDRSELPSMSEMVRYKITETISELFVNAQLHSSTDNIYTCGQFFPKSDEILFTLVDTGIGIKEKVNSRFGSNLSAIEAINWALIDKHTTKEDITGGIGLTLLKEFITLNKGKMQIISNDGFYELDKDVEKKQQFNGEFPGTIVNLLFKTDDNNSYILENEINPNEIF